MTIPFICHPPETVAAVRADYADGITLAEITATHGVVSSTIRRWCNPTGQPRPVAPLLSVAPLLQFLADRQTTPTSLNTQHGINLNRSIRDGGISWHVADRVAVALGCHAFQIWADEWWQAALGDQWDATNEWMESA